VTICVQAYLILRDNAHLLIALFEMMLSTGIPEVRFGRKLDSFNPPPSSTQNSQLRRESDILYLERALCLDKSKDQAAAYFKELINSCLKLSWSTQVNFAIHNLAHS
jgi:hypothetical protein